MAIKIVRRAKPVKENIYSETKNNNQYKVFILGIVDRYNIPKGKTVKQFAKEFYKISNKLDQGSYRTTVNDKNVKLIDYIFGKDNLSPLIRIVHSKQQVLILYTNEFGRVRKKISKGMVLNIITPTLAIMKNKGKIANYILLG